MSVFRHSNIFILLLSVQLLGGCAIFDSELPTEEQVIEEQAFKQPTKEKKFLKSTTWEIKALAKHFKDWHKVKYRYGGLSKKGVDCSGFVYLTFLNQFGVKLPRDTRSQVKIGTTIAKNKLKTGDLVFFKTGRNVRHVGIYMNEQRFIHASSSRGVTSSRLDKGYWAKKYWTARRLNPSILTSSKNTEKKWL